MQLQSYSLQRYLNMNSFTCIFQDFYFLGTSLNGCLLLYSFESDCKKVVHSTYLLEKPFGWVWNELKQFFCNDSYLVEYFFTQRREIVFKLKISVLQSVNLISLALISFFVFKFLNSTVNDLVHQLQKTLH